MTLWILARGTVRRAKGRRVKAWICFLFLCGALIFSFSLAPAGEIKYDTAGRRDPFVPLVGPDGVMSFRTKSADFIVEGIIYDPSGDSMVIVNGEVVRPGDYVRGASVVSIFRDRVILLQEDEEKIIWLREEIVEEGTTQHEKKR